MELNSKELEILFDLLGTPKITWSKYGFFFCKKRIPEMDELVNKKVLVIDESTEVWGPCVTYTVAKNIRSKLALHYLQGIE